MVEGFDNLAAQLAEDSIPLEGGVYELPKDEGNLLVNLARVQLKRDNPAAAAETAQRALTRFALLPDGYPGKALGQRAAWELLGQAQLAQEQRPQAIASYEQALAIARASGDRAGEGSVIARLGRLYERSQLWPQALEAYQQALDLQRATGDRAAEGATLGRIGAVRLQQGEPAAALAPLQAAAAIGEELRPGLSDADKVALFETQLQAYENLQAALIALDRVEAALETSERGRARAFVELLAARLNARAPEEASREAAALATPPPIAEIRRIAREQAATLVQYSLLGRQVYIWVVQPDGLVTLRSAALDELAAGDRQAPESFEALVALARRSLFSSRTSLANQRLRELHQLLVAPIADELPTDPGDRIIFIPQGPLLMIPFPALQDAAGRALIEQHAILTAPSIQVLDFTRQQARRGDRAASRSDGPAGEVLLVGNPAMPSLPTTDARPPKPLANLPGSEREAKEIGNLLAVEPPLGAAATETTILARLERARWVHLATHGLLDEVQHLGLSIPGAIALAPQQRFDPAAPNNPADGLLTAGEIFDLSLQADLVVLSACNTGLGRITGDGAIGLSRSFIAAGASSALVSLWAVPDAPTAELMEEFYRQLQQTPDKAIALQQAMLATRARHPHPRDWAAFTLIGEAD